MTLKSMVKTADGVPLKTGMMVYYLSRKDVTEPIRTCLISNKSFGSHQGTTADDIQAVNGKIFSSEFRVRKYKRYRDSKRTETFENRSYRREGGGLYLPLKEV